MIRELFVEYLQSVSSKFSHEETSEMGYRSDFEILLKGIFASINVSRFDHDAKAQNGNKPDFVVIKNDVPILYIEAKDIGISLDKIEKSEQMSRYYGYANLVLTDYLEFRFYRNGLRYGEPIKIASFSKVKRTINPFPDVFDNLAKTLVDFTLSNKESIKSGKHLSKIMGGKARRIRDNVKQFIVIKSEKSAELNKVYETIRELLVHDLSEEAFSDMYAQTLVYGLFVARYYDESPDNFTRQEARDLIPASNPLLRHFFDHIVGPDFDKRLEYIVNELCDVFSHANVEKLMNQYLETNLKNKTHRKQDTVIHFYEDFLNEYDPELRRKMGAYYTPLPVVEFIVRSVDSLLKSEFNLPRGLADTERLPSGKHRVQVLDPAVGTGTFISAVIGQIYRNFIGQEGAWPSYVIHELLPRIHGFELMMAPYTIAHLKLGMAFRETGFKYFNNRRLGIYLTNSLEKNSQQEKLFNAFGLANSIAQESKEAAIIKDETPIMVVVGNPPYSGESSNIQYTDHDVYKTEPTGGKLQEKNSKWINDDYVKFFRFAEEMVEKNQNGIVAMITAHGYIDNPTFRGMRWHLMKTFDEIYVLDLHGNSNKKEKSPDGTEDENVFNIKTGVSIFFGIKKVTRTSGLAKVFHHDLYGKRTLKFEDLNENIISSIAWTEVVPVGPNYEWVARNETRRAEYYSGFSLSELFIKKGVGIISARDSFVIASDPQIIIDNVRKFKDSSSETAVGICDEVGISNKKGWDATKSRKEVRSIDIEKTIKKISYRLFDTQNIFYHKSLVWRTVDSIMSLFNNNNFALLTCRQVIGDSWSHVFITSKLVDDSFLSNRSRERGYVFPLYSNPSLKMSNIKPETRESLEKITGKLSSISIFDYVYAVLHSSHYREKYNDFLKIDFPRIPYPKDIASFNALVKFGSELRLVHLLESPTVNNFVTTFPVAGTDEVGKIVFRENKVFINDEQYFGNVPFVAWEFHIGGYQPAQKWLKDRKGRVLTHEDLEHYQKIIVSLTETDRIMKEIDKIDFF